MLADRGKLVLNRDARDWIALTEQLPFVRFVAVDNEIAVSSVRLPGFPHPDPPDRIFAATALSQQAVLITRDHKLQGETPLTTLW